MRRPLASRSKTFSAELRRSTLERLPFAREAIADDTDETDKKNRWGRRVVVSCAFRGLFFNSFSTFDFRPFHCWNACADGTLKNPKDKCRMKEQNPKEAKTDGRSREESFSLSDLVRLHEITRLRDSRALTGSSDTRPDRPVAQATGPWRSRAVPRRCAGRKYRPAIRRGRRADREGSV